MLNELYELSKALDHHGLLQSATHPNVNPVGKGYCLLIQLDKHGVPRTTRLLQKEESGMLWKHSKGNHNSFPAVRVQKPLLAYEEGRKINTDEWKKAKISGKAAMLGALNYENINPECSDIKLSEWSWHELAPILQSEEPRLAALKQLIMVFPRAGQSETFVSAAVRCLQSKIQVCDHESELDFVKELLVGSENAANKKYVAGCMTYYDVYESDEFQNLVIASDTRLALISLLNDFENVRARENKQGSGIVSPLSGMPANEVVEKYPNPNVPLLGQMYLYTKNPDIPCLKRYAMIHTDAFLAGKHEISAINDAIAFLTSSSRKNKSWRAMSDSNRDKPNLLLAYLQDDPQNDAFLAQVLGDPSDYETDEEYVEETENLFEALCRQVLEEMEALINEKPQALVNLILLETLDPGRKQVVYERTITVNQFQSNLLSWSEAAKNHPPVEIRLRKGKGTIVYEPPRCPGPNDICQLLKMHYTRSGSAKLMKQSAVSLHDIYQLYMPPNSFSERDSDFLRSFLSIVVNKGSGLLGDVQRQMMADYALPATKTAFTQGQRAMLFISLISILLSRLGVRRENYMSGAPFNIGQFLQLSDMLHRLYCVQVRNGGDERKPLPAQLMGNELLPIASEHPVEGLNRLRDRMKIYLAWANTVTGEGAGLAKWILARYGEVSAKIVADDLSEQFTSVQQAQVLLGYLATIPYEKKNENGGSRV